MESRLISSTLLVKSHQELPSFHHLSTSGAAQRTLTEEFKTERHFMVKANYQRDPDV